ncbi:hypothetical protein M5689_001038 [Euphorbia peplus]|nr:hypothetical protein M5689_001038 [Euphorbia peplus]
MNIVVPDNWVVLGDFNVMQGAHDKTCRPPDSRPVQDFCNFIDNFSLSKIPSSASVYTWTNCRYGSRRLDCRFGRALASLGFLDFWNTVTCVTLARHCYDHHPILLSCAKGSISKARFLFQGMWLTHQNLHETIFDSWNDHHLSLPSMQLLCHKLCVL